MLDYIKRKKLEIEDWLRYRPFVRSSICRWKLWRTLSCDARAVGQLCAAARLTDDDVFERQIQERIVDCVRRLHVDQIDWPEFVPDFHEPHIVKAAILKPFVGAKEKGVIYISFESQWVKLLGLKNLRAFADRYTLVIVPSSSPHNLVNYVFPHAYPEPVFSLISNPHDAEVIPHISSQLIVVPLYASSWVNPDLFQPLPKSERKYDLIMVASWGKVKRHQALFSALRMMPKDMRVLLIGQDQEGRTADTTRDLARWYGVADRFTILTNQPYQEVTKLFCQSRASVVLSKREGSCLVITESMFADAPVAMLQKSIIGSRVFLNECTGRFLNDQLLARDLTDFVHDADDFRPRAWAENNIDCWRSSQTLNAILKKHAHTMGQEWSQDIAPIQQSPDPILARPGDRRRLAPEREEIARRFGLEIGPALVS